MPKSKDQYVSLLSAMYQQNEDYDSVWIDLQRDDESGEWLWGDGEILTWADWYDGVTPVDGIRYYEDNNYVVINTWGGGIGDFEASWYPAPYVCEKGKHVFFYVKTSSHELYIL